MQNIADVSDQQFQLTTNMKKQILETLEKYWGYKSFRPFQEEAIQSILDERDTLTVLPTGGGKSLCFQLPALMLDGMAVIISPLISLMKDQVDDLKEMGVAAEVLNSSLSETEDADVKNRIRAGQIKLLYISPERLVLDSTIDLLNTVHLSFFVIDEAHCISHWGHNFRAEYRQLQKIKSEFKKICIHAFTATATKEVQKDIVDQLALVDPHLYIGAIDRPNLTYRVLPRSNALAQIVKVLKNHPDEPGIIYCLKRSDVDDISLKLNELGYKNLPYHAGLPDAVRKKNQDEFAQEKTNIMVATIAFGMGVDRSNIRYVIHAAMPKSIEHYQQETGRAGRDGLNSECVLFYSGSDYRTWEYLTRDSADKEILMQKLQAIVNFCARPSCRHRSLSNYFSQDYALENCGSCDLCLGEMEMVKDPLIVAQKVISCVLRVKERFGADHIADILKGNLTPNITRWGHDKLSTFALLSDQNKNFIRFMIEQLILQGYLRREGEFMTIAMTETGRKVIKGEVTPKLAQPIVAVKKREVEKVQKEKRAADWEGIDLDLFEALRAKRAELARAKNVPAYIIFGDKSLKDMAHLQPLTPEDFTQVYGVGAAKQKEYAETFIKVIAEFKAGNPITSTNI